MNQRLILLLIFIGANLAYLVFLALYPTPIWGQENKNSTEEACKNAKEILCKEYNSEYCEGQEVTNSTKPNCEFIRCDPSELIRPNETDPEFNCFTKKPSLFSGEYSRCVLN